MFVYKAAFIACLLLAGASIKGLFSYLLFSSAQRQAAQFITELRLVSQSRVQRSDGASAISDPGAFRAGMDSNGRWWTVRRESAPVGISDQAKRAAHAAADGTGNLRSLGSQLKEVIFNLRLQSGGSFADARNHSLLADFLREISERELDPQRRIALFCESLAHYGEALERQPRDAKLLMNWANLRQTLGSVDCGLKFSGGDFRGALRSAIRFDPRNVSIRNAAALLLLFSGEQNPDDRREAFAYWHEVLKFGINLPQRQKRFIYQLVHDRHSLRALIPARFPQITEFSAYLDSSLPRLTRGIADASRVHESADADDKSEIKLIVDELSRMQLEAMRDSADAFDRDLVPYQIHTQRLSGLLPYVLNSSVRQAIDGELSMLSARRGDSKLSQYLKDRSELKNLKIVKTTSVSDTRPARTPLLDWERNAAIALDDFYRSVGFFLGDQQSVRIIEFSLPERPSRAVLEAIKVFTSSDNQNWAEISASVDREVLPFNNRYLMAIRVPTLSHKYWKIHVARPDREGSLTGHLDRILSVYGMALFSDELQ